MLHFVLPKSQHCWQLLGIVGHCWIHGWPNQRNISSNICLFIINSRAVATGGCEGCDTPPPPQTIILSANLRKLKFCRQSLETGKFSEERKIILPFSNRYHRLLMTAPVTVEIGENLVRMIDDRSNSLMLNPRQGLPQIAKLRSPPGPQTYKVKKNYGLFCKSWRGEDNFQKLRHFSHSQGP